MKKLSLIVAILSLNSSLSSLACANELPIYNPTAPLSVWQAEHSDSGSMASFAVQFFSNGLYCSVWAGVGALAVNTGQWRYNSDKSAINVDLIPISLDKLDKNGFTALIERHPLMELDDEERQIMGNRFNLIGGNRFIGIEQDSPVYVGFGHDIPDYLIKADGNMIAPYDKTALFIAYEPTSLNGATGKFSLAKIDLPTQKNGTVNKITLIPNDNEIFNHIRQMSDETSQILDINFTPKGKQLTAVYTLYDGTTHTMPLGVGNNVAFSEIIKDTGLTNALCFASQSQGKSNSLDTLSDYIRYSKPITWQGQIRQQADWQIIN